MADSRAYLLDTHPIGKAGLGNGRGAPANRNGGKVSPELAAFVRMLAAFAVDDFLQEKSLPVAAACDETVTQEKNNAEEN